jgi:hypothetical protein
MRTRSWRIASSVVGALVVFGGTAQWLASGATANPSGLVEPQATRGELPVPADLEALGLGIPDTSSEGKISMDDAVAVALREHGQQFAGGKIDAYLVRLTDPATAGGDLEITDRDVWIVRFSGLDIQVSGPDTPDRIPVDGGTIEYAYVYVDAVTGEWLLTRAEG